MLPGVAGILLLGLASTLAVVYLVARVGHILALASPPQTIHVFLKWNRAWIATSIEHRDQTWIYWHELGPDQSIGLAQVAESSPERLAAEAASFLQNDPRRAPSHRVLRRPPSWGSMASAASPPDTSGIDRGIGWPLPCMWFREVGDSMRHDGAWWIGTPGSRLATDPPLPSWVAWRGLFLNVAFWSAAWAIVLLIPLALHRLRRTRVGLCTRCRYDLRATPAGSPCPECGLTSPPGATPPAAPAAPAAPP